MSQLLCSKTYVTSDGSVPVTAPLVSVNSPAFSAYKTTTTTAGSSSSFNDVTGYTLDTGFSANGFDVNTGIFAPTVAGIYQVNGQISYSGVGLTRALCSIYKGTSIYKAGTDFAPQSSTNAFGTVSCLVFLDGTGATSTGTIKLVGFYLGTSSNFLASTPANTYFSAALLIRTA